MTKQKLGKIRDAIKVLAELPDEDWESFLKTIKGSCGNLEVSEKKVESSASLEEKVALLIKKLGIPANIKGYTYLRSAIVFYMKHENPEKILITKELYPAIAEEHFTTPGKVERGIRHAVEVSCERVYNKGFHNQIFGDVANFKTGRPSNGEFIASIAEYLKAN